MITAMYRVVLIPDRGTLERLDTYDRAVVDDMVRDFFADGRRGAAILSAGSTRLATWRDGVLTEGHPAFAVAELETRGDSA